jgi:two-component sensor histidine kinase
MATIRDLDLCDRLSPRIPVWATQIAVGVASTIACILVRRILDQVAPGAAPFALIYPAIILATLFARWFAGLVTATLTILLVWYFLFPVQFSFRFADRAGALSLIAVTVAAVITIVIAEIFRAAAHRAMRERDRQIADRDLFLAEFDHRMKNNFAIVAGLLDLQKRRTADPATAAALATAQMRVDSIARAHRHLYRGNGEPGSVEMNDYLGDLCGALSESLFPRGDITLSCNSDTAAVPRDRAVSIGLVVNELVTNAAKHAFKGRETGQVVVAFRNQPGGGWILEVSDNGIGMPDAPVATGNDHGLGSRLIEAFARQAGGKVSADSDRTGTRVMLALTA